MTLQATDFIDKASKYGYDFYAGVPGPFLDPLINTAIDSEPLSYVSAANEGDAVTLAAGRALSGRRAVAMMQNSGLGNAVSPLTSLTWVFRLPILLIISWPDTPNLDDEPQQELMEAVTPGLLDMMDVAWETFPETAQSVDEVLARAEAHMSETSRPYALVMRKETIAPATLKNTASPSQSRGAITFRPAPLKKPGIARRDALAHLVDRTDPERHVIISAAGHTSRELYALADRPNHLYMAGSVGCAPLLGLGLATARPDLDVIVVDGDGAALMHLGAMTTLAACGPTNLFHLLLDNGMYESTGGQATISAGLSFAAIAAASGYRTTYEGYEQSVIDQMLAGSSQGPAFSHLHIVSDPSQTDLPRPAQTPFEISRRLMSHIEVQ